MLNLSIIIPVYNVEAYIEECLDSVVAQSDAKANIECIIVDDCSPDGSMDIVWRFVDNYQGAIRFRMLRHEVNRGLSAARNTGIDAATGDYVFFIDSDDYLMEHGLKTLVDGLLANPDADVVQGNSLFLGKNVYIKRKEPFVLLSKKERLSALVNSLITCNSWNRLVRRSVLIDNRVFFKEGIIFEDYPWSYQLMAVVQKVLVLPQVTYYYRLNANSIIHTRQLKIGKTIYCWDVILTTMIKQERNIRGSLLVYIFSRLLEIQDMIDQHGCSEEELQAFRRLRSRLLKNIISHGRPLLLLFSLTIFKPFYHIYSFHFVRRNYHILERIMLALELMIDRLKWQWGETMISC